MKQSGRGSYRWLTIAMVAVAGMYLWHVNDQYGRLNDLNQRELSNAGTELKTALDTAIETMTRFEAKWVEWKANQQQQGESNVGAGARAGSEPLLCEFDDNQPYLDSAECASSSPRRVRWSSNTTIQPVTLPTLGVRVASENGTPLFRFRTDKMLRELAFSDSFGLIFLATADEGEVLHQDDPPQRRWLRHLRWGERTFRDANADRPPSFQIRNLKQVLGGSAETWNQMRSVSSRTSVQLGGAAYTLYLQPLVLEHGDQRIGLVIGGAVARNTLFRNALALNADVVAVLVFLLLLGLLGFPFVKLVSLDRRERFRLRDVSLLYVSTAGLLVLMTCGSLAVDGYVRWQAVADHGLGELARHLEGRLLDEITAIRDQVKDYDDMVRRMASIEDCARWRVRTGWFKNVAAAGQDPSLPWPSEKVHFRQVSWIRSDGRQVWKITVDSIPGKSRIDQRVYFRSIGDGNLFRISNQEPAFFMGPDRSLADGKFYTFFSMKSSIEADAYPARCHEVANVDVADNSDATRVVAAIVHLRSLDRQPLPEGYGFALFNREGRVLYHSDNRLSLRENLYEELSQGSRARSMVYAGHAGELGSRYRERPHHLYLHPVGLFRALQGDSATEPGSAAERNFAGFYLAAFRDTSIEWAVVGRVFVAALVVPLSLVALLAVALWMLARVVRCTRAGSATHEGTGDDHQWGALLWPHGGLKHVYTKQTAAFVGALVAGIVLCRLLQNFAVLLLVPLSAAAAGIWIYWHWDGRKAQREPLDASASAWQTLSVLLASVCIVIVPSIVVFELALNHEFAKLIVTEREWIETQQSDVVPATTVEALADDYSRLRITQLNTARPAYSACVPAPFDARGGRTGAFDRPDSRRPEVLRVAQSGTSRASPAAVANVGSSFATCVAMTGSAAVIASSAGELEPFGMDGPLIGVLHWLDDWLPFPNELLTRQQFHDGEFAYSPDGTVFRTLRVSGTAFLGFAIMIGLLVWWIRWNTRHIFLAQEKAGKVEEPEKEVIEGRWSQLTGEEQMVLLQVVRDRIANPRQHQTVVRLVEKGLLTMDPDLRPSFDVDKVFQDKREKQGADLQNWEDVRGARSWRNIRTILIVSVGTLALFLFATQPSLQSNLAGIASGVTAALTAILKLREAIESWLPGRRSAA